MDTIITKYHLEILSMIEKITFRDFTYLASNFICLPSKKYLKYCFFQMKPPRITVEYSTYDLSSSNNRIGGNRFD